MSKVYRKSNYIMDLMQLEEDNKRKALIESGEAELQKHIDDEAGLNIYNIKEQRMRREQAYGKFLNEMKTEFLAEGIYHFYNNAIEVVGESNESVNNEEIKKAYVYRFIEENGGASKVISSFKSKTSVLSELALMVEKACNKAKEKVEKEDMDTFRVDTQVKSEFIDELKEKDTEEVTDMIQAKVSDAVGDFIQKNKDDKAEIDKITADTQEKIDSAEGKEKLQESFRIESNKKIVAIQTRKPRTIFEAMVKGISKSVMKDESLNESFTNDEGKIDFDMVMEASMVMYTFFETVSTLKMVEVTESYIKDIYESLA